MLSSQEESVLKTLAFFDIFSRPLKREEIFDNLQQTTNNKQQTTNDKIIFSEIKKNLRGKNLQNFIGNEGDFYFLKGRKDLVQERKKREKISKKNWRKLKRITKKINLVPFLKGAFVSGSLAINNSNEKSDIDLLIIAKSGRIFTVRFFLTLLLNFLGERRRPEKIAGKICLNHYFSENSLEMKFPSIYNAYAYLCLLPIIDRKEVFKRFREKNNWMRDYLLFWQKKYKPPFEIKKKSILSKCLEKILAGSFGDFFERKIKGRQIKRKEKNYPEGIKKGRVILEDNLIELHPDSPEEEILKKYKSRLDFLKKKC